MFTESPHDARKVALEVLTAQFVTQGHPAQYATHMATAAIFQADLELRNAQLSRLLSWLEQNQPEAYTEALTLVEATREEFERRVQA